MYGVLWSSLAAVRSIVVNSQMRKLLCNEGIVGALKYALTFENVHTFKSGFCATLPVLQLILAVEALQRCAWDVENRSMIKEDGIEDVLRELREVWKRKKDKSEGSIRLSRALTEALDTLDGRLDVADLIPVSTGKDQEIDAFALF